MTTEINERLDRLEKELNELRGLLNAEPQKFTVGNVTIYQLNGKRHREDGPAVEYANGDKEYYINGERHRVNGPAIEYANGDKEYFISGKLHREDGPAKDFKSFKGYYLDGKPHRVDGPAIEHEDGLKKYHIDGVKYEREDYLKHELVIKALLEKYSDKI